jgi:molybdopterin-biosynthesis enzyme MoeA-like protein
MIKIDINIGDEILTGRFKNKKITVKTITYDEYGMPMINGRPVYNFRVKKN